MKRPQYFDNIPCPHCRNINNPDVCKKCFYDSEYKPKQWHVDAVAVPTHLKAVFSLFHNYYHPDSLFKVKGRRMSIDEIIMKLVMMIDKKVSFEDMNPIVESLSSLSQLIEDGSWTPCSEATPKIAGEYLVTYHPCYWGEVRPELKVGFDSFRGKTTWAKNKYQKVVAWKPKPEPYFGDSE